MRQAEGVMDETTVWTLHSTCIFSMIYIPVGSCYGPS